MFKDGRSKSIIFLCHCILNQNAKMDRTAAYPGPIQEIINKLANSNFGIVQMPCPEFLCLGLTRNNSVKSVASIVQENTRVRKLMATPQAMDKMRNLIEDILYQILEYKKNGFVIRGIIGVNRSPSCGVNTTSDNDQEIAGEGVFIYELRKALEENNLKIKIVGIKAFEPEDIISKINEIFI